MVKAREAAEEAAILVQGDVGIDGVSDSVTIQGQLAVSPPIPNDVEGDA